MKLYVGEMDTFNLWKLFDYDELTINMRPKDDKVYYEILSRIRLGLVTDVDIKTLTERQLKFNSANYEEVMQEICQYLEEKPPDTVRLLPTRTRSILLCYKELIQMKLIL